MLQIPDANERGQYRDRINCSLVFASKEIALLSTGTGKLLVIDTFSRAENLMWKVSQRLSSGIVILIDAVHSKLRRHDVHYMFLVQPRAI